MRLLGVWLLSIHAASVLAAAPAPGAVDPSLPPLPRSQALVALSATLVETARSGQGAATAFRIDVAHYRESLRDLVRDNEKLPAQERLPQPLVLDLVRMVGLLQSAAQCQTGRHIVCPPDLMDKLTRQQATMQQGLAAASGQAR